MSTADGRVLLANVHAGGIPRSTDSGATWQPTINIDTDVHEVCAHPTDPDLVYRGGAAGIASAHQLVIGRGVCQGRCSKTYFAGAPPFGSGGKKSEFPDAFVIEALIEWTEDRTPSDRTSLF